MAHVVCRHGPRLWVVGCLVAVFTVLDAAPASGHAIVKRTEPAIDEVVANSPARVLMEFNEPVEISFGSIRVFDAHGRRVDDGETRYVEGSSDAVEVPLEPELSRGTYTVAWRIVSADGHPIGEAFVFHVGAPGENPRGIVDEVLAGEGRAGSLESGLAAVGRWLLLVSLLVLAGAVVFLVLVWGRLIAPPDVVGGEFAAGWRRVVVAAWATALVSTLLLFVLQGALAADVPLREALSSNVLREVAETRFGVVSLIRLGLLAGCVAVWPVVRRSVEPGSSVGAAAVAVRPTVGVLTAGGVLVLALLATPGLSGHAGTTDPVGLNVAADMLHMVAAAAWMGGLLLLLGVAFPATRNLPDGARARVLAPMVARFSDVAVVAVAVLVVSGGLRAWAEVRTLDALTDANYGVVLLVKLAAVLPILALGAINNRRTKPQIVRLAAESDPGGARRPLWTLRRLVGAEVAMGAIVIAITALLVNLPPARVEAGADEPSMSTASIGHHELHVIVDPGQVGENRIHLSATDDHGEPAHFDEVRVLFRMPEEDIGPLVATAEAMAPGEYVVHGHQLSVPGEWALEIVARTGEFDQERTTVDVVVDR
ncbi:MAG: copper resistance CopC/CopD family protein [Acidimicrobiales bacterium]